jgi:GNAT superfamily N-acetyltransferase
MEKEQARVKLREASVTDREGILRIASATWEGWDYVPILLDEWIAEGGLYVAELAGEIVGITKTTELSPGELWLEALRVAEEHRKKGLGRRIAEQQLELAIATRPQSIRLSTANVNTASLAIIRHLGFKEYAVFDYFEQSQPLAELKEVEFSEDKLLADADVEEKAWKLILSSQELRASKGLMPHTWRFFNWTEELFRSLVAEELVYVTPQVGGVLVLLRNHYAPSNREIAFLEGDERSLETLGRLVLFKLASLEEGRLVAFAASNRKHKIIENLGMRLHERIKKVYVFEYPLGKM